jgi:hypothetical protein
MQSRIPLLAALFLIVGVAPAVAQKRVPASVWRQTVGQEALRFKGGDRDVSRDRIRGVSNDEYYDDRYYDDRYYDDADSDSDSDSDSDGGVARGSSRFPSSRYPSDYPSDRERRTQGDIGTILRDAVLGRSGDGGGGDAARGTDGIGGVLGRTRSPGQARSQDRLPSSIPGRTDGTGVGGVLGSIVRGQAAQSAGATLSRVIAGLLGGR